jgi:hypothetical protein
MGRAQIVERTVVEVEERSSGRGRLFGRHQDPVRGVARCLAGIELDEHGGAPGEERGPIHRLSLDIEQGPGRQELHEGQGAH